MRTSLIILLAIGLAAGCSKKDSEITCSTYFLSEESDGRTQTKYVYNSDGLIAFMQNQGANTRFDFTYKNKILQKVVGATATYTFWYANGKMVATVRSENSGAKVDSIEYLYDGSNQMARRNFYIPVQKTGVLYKFVNYSYTGNNPTKVDFYNYADSPPYSHVTTFKYTYDTHPKPYPAEYQLFDIAISNTNSENNITSIEVISQVAQSTPPSTMPVSYNQAGYPTHANGLDYKYSCTPAMQ